MAIGVHDLSKINFPLTYKAVSSDFSFVPLDSKKRDERLGNTERTSEGQGIWLYFGGKGFYPMIIDSMGEAISFPPIINAEKTRVTDKTRDIFIDVTGFDEYADKALKILACMLSDRGE